MKKDSEIFNVVSAAIKRSTNDISEWKHTKLWENNNSFHLPEIGYNLNLNADELIISSFYLSKKLWTIITTRKVYNYEADIFHNQSIKELSEFSIIEFVRMKDKNNIGKIVLGKGNEINWHIGYESGNASLAIIVGIKTLIALMKHQ